MGRRKKHLNKAPRIVHKTCISKSPEDLDSDETIIRKPNGVNSAITEEAINVYARLNLPLIHITRPLSRPNELTDGSDEEDTIELNFWPRFIFVSNLCLVCVEQSTKVCEFCGMVSYCSDNHKKQDWTKHRDLCKILTEIYTTKIRLSLLSELSPDHYRIYRLKLIDIVECGLGRRLELWEKEIILYPRVCQSCRNFSKTLKCCPTCGIALFCEYHNDGHQEWCREFQVFRRILFMQHKNGHVNPEIPDTFQKKPLRLLDNFDSLIVRLYDRSIYYCNMDCYTYCTLSHILTVPLTVLYSMQISYKKWESIDSFTIHVIGAEFQFECINLYVWEKFFLHLLPNLKYLRLMFVGSELRLPEVPINLLTTVKICSVCKSLDRRVNISFHPGEFYHNFCRSKEFIKPDLVCLFNPGLYRETGYDGRDTWPETIREFCKLKVPVCITSYTEIEIPREIIRIKSITNVETILKPQRNPFASIKPDRNFVSDDTMPLIYKNYYLTIVKGES